MYMMILTYLKDYITGNTTFQDKFSILYTTNPPIHHAGGLTVSWLLFIRFEFWKGIMKSFLLSLSLSLT